MFHTFRLRLDVGRVAHVEWVGLGRRGKDWTVPAGWVPFLLMFYYYYFAIIIIIIIVAIIIIMVPLVLSAILLLKILILLSFWCFLIIDYFVCMHAGTPLARVLGVRWWCGHVRIVLSRGLGDRCQVDRPVRQSHGWRHRVVVVVKHYLIPPGKLLLIHCVPINHFCWCFFRFDMGDSMRNISIILFPIQPTKQ